MVGTAGLDGELTTQNKIMVGGLAVIMPGNYVAISQREDTNLNVRADSDRFHVFYLVVRHTFKTKSPLAPVSDRSRFGLDVSSANDLGPAFRISGDGGKPKTR